ncbi:MAG: transketolase C-terminal domain-containing protein [Candidatus Hydrogenedentota bacterium]
MPNRIIKYTEAIKEATDQIMEVDQDVIVMGLEVSYKNGADGTTAGLKEKYPYRIIETPQSENAITGMAIGAAITGLRPIVHHGRIEFALFAADQIFTQAAKWNYMFGGEHPVPIVFRINIGRQWGQGPQHTQALYSLFGNALGLKVVIPSTPYMAKGLLISAVRDKNPVVILESRWLFSLRQDVPTGLYNEPLDKAVVVKKGTDLTIVSYGDGLITAYEALKLIRDHVDVELIDLVSINPVDYETILKSVKKTGRLITVDTTNHAFSIGTDVIADIAKQKLLYLKNSPVSLSCPNVPVPTSTALTKYYYPTKIDIANAALRLMDKPTIKRKLTFEELHLLPNLIIKKF